MQVVTLVPGYWSGSWMGYGHRDRVGNALDPDHGDMVVLPVHHGAEPRADAGRRYAGDVPGHRN